MQHVCVWVCDARARTHTDTQCVALSISSLGPAVVPHVQIEPPQNLGPGGWGTHPQRCDCTHPHVRYAVRSRVCSVLWMLCSDGGRYTVV